MDRPDELEAINGIGPTIAAKLRSRDIGLRELADYNEDDLDRLDEELGARGNVKRQDWRTQAIDLLSKQASEPAKPTTATPPVLANETTKTAVKPAADARRARYRLNRDEHYGEVIGKLDGFAGAHFVQTRDDKEVYFDHDGIEVFAGLEPDERDGDDNIEPKHKTTKRTLHLLYWLDKKNDYPFDLVIAAIQDRYGHRKQLKTEKQARQFLHETMRGGR